MNIKKNLFLNTTYQLLNLIVPLITAPYLARTVGAEGIGIYSFYNSIAYYFVIFIMLGLNNYGNRTVARVRGNQGELSEAFWNIFCMQFMLGMLSICIYLIFLMLNTENRIIAFLNIFYVISAVFDISWFFSGLEKFDVIVTRNIIVKLGSVICILLFVKSSSDLALYVFIMTCSILISQVSVWPFLKGKVKWCSPTWENVKSHIKPNMILFIPVIAVSLYKIMDKIMIGVFSTKVQVGYYENSEKIINIPQALINSLGTVMLPRISNMVAKGETQLGNRYMRDSMQYSMALSIGAAFGLIGISQNFAVLFFGEEFADCGILIAMLAPTIAFNAWANVIRTQYLLPRNRDKSYIISVTLGAVINFIINAILIGKMGAFGATIGTIFAESVVMFSQTFAVKSEIPVVLYIKDNICFCGAGIIMLLLINFISKMNLNSVVTLLAQLGGGIVTYAITSVLFLYLINRERFGYLAGAIIKRDK